MKRGAVILTAALLLVALPLGAQQRPTLRPRPGAPAPRAQTPAGEKCSLSGQVLEAGTDTPLRKARITLSLTEGRGRGEDPEPFAATSDAAGSFTITGIEPGRYRAWAERNGYVAQEYGRRGVSRAGTMLALAPGQNLTGIVFRLAPAGVITGCVTDEDGEPLAGVSVQALRYRYRQGRRELHPEEDEQSDDRGEYRIFALAPGRYYVSATYSPGVRFRTGGSASRAAGAVGDENYAPTYYPGTTEPERAAAVEIAAGHEETGVDFRLAPVRAVRVRSRVVNTVAEKKTAGGTSVWIMPRQAGYWVMSFDNNGQVREDGSYELRGVVPGSYYVGAMWLDVANNKPYFARAAVEVGATDVEGVELVIQPGFEVAGRLRVEGRPPQRLQPRRAAAASSDEEEAEDAAEEEPGAASPFREFSVSLQPEEQGPLFHGDSGRVEEDGSFKIESVAPGTYTVEVSVRGDHYVKSVRLGGADVLDKGIDLSAGPPGQPLEVVVSPHGGRIDGAVLTEQKLPAGGAQVALIPELAKRKREELFKTASTDQHGRFTLRGIPPGEYKLFAWAELEEPGAYQDPEFLKAYEERGKEVSVEEKQRRAVELTLIASKPQ